MHLRLNHLELSICFLNFRPIAQTTPQHRVFSRIQKQKILEFIIHARCGSKCWVGWELQGSIFEVCTQKSAVFAYDGEIGGWGDVQKPWDTQGGIEAVIGMIRIHVICVLFTVEYTLIQSHYKFTWIFAQLINQHAHRLRVYPLGVAHYGILNSTIFTTYCEYSGGALWSLEKDPKFVEFADVWKSQNAI